MSLITHLTTLDQHDSLVKAKSGKLVVIDFHASWCGPCHAIAPKFESLSNSYRGTCAFAKVDIDVGKDIAAQYSIRAMPTFVFLKDGKKVDEVKGADASAIEAAIKRHGGSGSGGGASAAFSGVGKTLGGATIVPPKEPGNLPDLKIILGVLLLMGLWMYYGSKIEGNMGTPVEPEGGFMM